MADENTGSQGAAGTSEGTTGTNDAGDASQSVSGAAGTSNDTSTNDDDTSSTEGTVSRDEFEQLKKRMQAADKRSSELQSELDQKKRAEQDELTNTKQDLEQAQARIAELEKLMGDRALENDFLKYGKYTWVDPGDALALLDREGVEVKDGKVTGLGPAIEKLAKAKPHLLKSESDGKGGTGSSEASGSANNGKRKGENGQVPDKDRLAKRFPALRK